MKQLKKSPEREPDTIYVDDVLPAGFTRGDIEGTYSKYGFSGCIADTAFDIPKELDGNALCLPKIDGTHWEVVTFEGCIYPLLVLVRN